MRPQLKTLIDRIFVNQITARDLLPISYPFPLSNTSIQPTNKQKKRKVEARLYPSRTKLKHRKKEAGKKLRIHSVSISPPSRFGENFDPAIGISPCFSLFFLARCDLTRGGRIRRSCRIHGLRSECATMCNQTQKHKGRER